MRRMEPTTTDRQAASTTRDEQDLPQIRSLTVPGLLELPPMPPWLRKLLRRTDTPTSR
jgi:hypothetical protein